MIAASEPQEFVPCGRQHMSRHPGEVVLPSTQTHMQSETFLLHRLSQVAIDDEPSTLEQWKIRASSTEEPQCEEELYVKGKTTIWSRGAVSSSSTNNSRIVLCSYTSESPVKYALWCTFHTCSSDKAAFEFNPQCATSIDEPKGVAMPSVCIVDTDNIKVFTSDGEDYVSSLQFQVGNVWPTKFGLLLERAPPSCDMFHLLSPPMNTSHLPTMFSLLHPLDEMSPVLARGSTLSFMNNPALSIVFTCEDPSIAVLYNSHTGLHSVWKIRKAKAEECRAMCSQDSMMDNSSRVSSMPSTIASNSMNVGSGNTTASSMSMFGNKTNLSLYQSRRGSDGFKTSSVHNSTAHSPRSNYSIRFNSPIGQASPQRLGRSLDTSQVLEGTPPRDARLMTSTYICGSQADAKPLFPELCLELMWMENAGAPLRDNYAASRVFLSHDLVGQQYLYYLVAQRSILHCDKLDKTNTEHKLIFGATSPLVAKDATALPTLNMLALVDLCGGISLYTGTTLVGKVHVAGISSALSTSNYLSLNMGSTFGTPYPRRNSILSSSRPTSALEPARFDDEVHLLSPVLTANDISRSSFNYSPSEDQSSNCVRVSKLLALRDAVANRVTLEYSDGPLYRISLPELCSSPLVCKCLGALRQVLPRDKALQLVVKWYGVRNAPGTQDIAPNSEWQLFIGVLLDMLGYCVDKLCLSGCEASSASPVFASKKKRASDCGSEQDWGYLLRSAHHQSLAAGLSSLLGLQLVGAHLPTMQTSETARVNCGAMLFTSIPLVLYSLHLLYEELKLDMLLSESMPLLAQLLHQLSFDLRLGEYVDHYWKDFPAHCSLHSTRPSQVTDKILKKLVPPSFMPPEPPNIFAHINAMIKKQPVQPYPYITQVNQVSRDMVQLAALIVHGDEEPRLQLGGWVKQAVPPGSRAEPQEVLTARDADRSTLYPMPERAVLLMTEMGLARRSLNKLPAGIALLLNTVLYRCRASPPVDWPEEAYKLIFRQDLAAQCRQLKHPAHAGDRTNALNSSLPTSPSAGGNGENRKTSATPRVAECDQDDGMEAMDMELLKLRFCDDHRVSEVRRLLQSSAPVPIAISQRPEVSDHEFIEEQEKHLYALCTRTMALPLGRGMFTLRTSAPVITETLPIPRLCLTGRVPPRDTTVDLTHIEVVPNMNLWPLFHNGVAAGLRIAPNALDIDSTWIVFNKPKGASEVPTEHAGFLMALGLNGHLTNLAVLKTFEYLIKCHEMTSVGLLLGVAACKRGTMDVASTKLMSIHIEALLPPTSIEMDMPQNIQVAAMLGVGLVYEGTAHRHIAEVLLTEIGRPPGPEMENSVDRESYSLAAGLALGLVVLGKGSKLCGLGDLAISDTLHYYMVGGHRRPLSGSQKEKYKSPSYQIREGDSVNIDVTSPGATLALGLMYFNTGNRAVADWMRAPDTQYLLDFVRPDFLLLRIVARSLILWDAILPIKDWVESNVPEAIRPYCLVKPRPGMPENVDYETMNQAYCNILGGACMAIGLRYAGSANQVAFQTLLFYAKMFTSLSGKSIAELAGKSTIETCLNVIVLSLAMVMSGTGELEVVRLCRYLRSRVGPTVSVVTYGSHVATHMALGLLFLGGGRYTLGTSPPAIAAMICAFFPKFPTHSNDNRYHLQAFRHLYVLAAEPRLVIPRDIDTGCLCYAHLTVVYMDTSDYRDKEARLKAPCILPELSKLIRVTVEDDRYWSIVFHKDRNWDQLQNLLNNSGCLDVKQKAGCLSYVEDPQGFRSLLAKTLTCDTAISWSVSAESICSFSSDPSVVNFARYFLDRGQVSVKSVSELELMQSLTLLAYECVTQDKLTILPLWITLTKALQSLRTAPSLYLTWQLKLLATQVLSWTDAIRNVPALVSADLALSVEQHVRRTLDSWETDLGPLLKQYLLSGLPDVDMDVRSKRLATYLTFYDIPSPYKLTTALQGETNPLAILSKLQHLQLPPLTIRKISAILECG